MFTHVRIAIVKMTTNKRWWGYGEKGTLCTVGGNVSWYSHWGKLNGGFTKKKRKETNKQT